MKIPTLSTGDELKILLADDSSLCLEKTREILDKHGFEGTVLTCMCGKDVLDIVKEHSPDIILLDLFLPDIYGIEVLRQIREVERDETIVILLTGWKDTESLSHAYSLGVFDYITKPVEETEFLVRLKAAIRSKEEMLKRRKAEETLRKSETKYRELAESLPVVVFEIDLNGKLTYMNGSGIKCLRLTAEDIQAGINAADILIPKEHEKTQSDKERLFVDSEDMFECTGLRKDGTPVPLLVRAVPVEEGGCATGIRGVAIDISERKQLEKKLEYLSLRDPLTGLYNRHYFEIMMNKMDTDSDPVGVIVIDVDGLKIINDLFGHEKGDNHLKMIAKFLQGCFRSEDIISRVGGDEFAVLMPKTPQSELRSTCLRLQQEAEKFARNNPEALMSISFGYACRVDSSKTLQELFTEADNLMYANRHREQGKGRTLVVKNLSRVLQIKSYSEPGHVERLKRLAGAVSEKLNLSDRQKDNLMLLCEFHDIGKLGIDEEILYKPGPLSEEDLSETRRHCEIGHYIALSAPGIAPVADLILKHHEWWNGKGYPLGISGEEIPLECRIFSLADAFDALTTVRKYKETVLSFDAAAAELRRCSGTQFDPGLVEVFCRAIGCD